MAFKMNTSIGKIYAKIQGTKPYAKAIATAKAPIPATGNVGIPPSPLKKILLGKARTEAKRKAKEAAEKAKNDTLTKAQVAAGRAQEMNDKLTNKAGDIRIDAPSTGDSASASKSTNSKKGGKDPYKKAADKDKNLGSYVKKQKSLKKGTPEWNANQNKINEAYGVKKRYGKGDSTTSTTSTPATESTTTKKVISQKDKDKEKGRQKAIMDRPRVKMGDNKSKDTKVESDLVGKSRKETRLDRRLAKTQSKGRAIADGKGTKTPAEQRKALRLKRREGRLKKRIENKTKKGPKKGIPITEQGKLNRVEKKDESKSPPKSKKVTKFKIDENLGKRDLLKPEKKKLSLANALDNK